MIIYLDYIFIENFLIDYVLLKQTSYVARKEITQNRAIIAAVAASIYVVVMIYFKLQELDYLICKILLVVIMIYICFRPKRINEYIKLIILFFLISAINVGTVTFISNLLNLQSQEILVKVVVYSTSILLSKFFTSYMWKIYRQDIRNDDLIYEVKVHLGGKTYKYSAFLDTGNNVFSYAYNVPVVFAEVIDDTMIKELKTKEAFEIKTVTLSNESKKRAYVFDKIEISKKNKTWHVKVAIVFEKTKLSKDNSYNMLLNYILYAQDLGGIKI